MMKWVVGVAVALLHALVQFFSWATAMQPAMRWLWRIISFPAFLMTSEDVSTVYFWPIFLLNSVIWGAVAAAAVMGLGRRRTPVAAPPRA